MKVRELIKELLDCDPNDEVYVRVGINMGVHKVKHACSTESDEGKPARYYTELSAEE